MRKIKLNKKIVLSFSLIILIGIGMLTMIYLKTVDNKKEESVAKKEQVNYTKKMAFAEMKRLYPKETVKIKSEDDKYYYFITDEKSEFSVNKTTGVVSFYKKVVSTGSGKSENK